MNRTRQPCAVVFFFLFIKLQSFVVVGYGQKKNLPEKKLPKFFSPLVKGLLLYGIDNANSFDAAV
jgi:hypothetical protein